MLYLCLFVQPSHTASRRSGLVGGPPRIYHCSHPSHFYDPFGVFGIAMGMSHGHIRAFMWSSYDTMEFPLTLFIHRCKFALPKMRKSTYGRFILIPLSEYWYSANQGTANSAAISSYPWGYQLWALLYQWWLQSWLQCWRCFWSVPIVKSMVYKPE